MEQKNILQVFISNSLFILYTECYEERWETHRLFRIGSEPSMEGTVSC